MNKTKNTKSPKDVVKKQLTTEEKMKLLNGYKKFEDNTKWTTIPIGTHVRLVKADGSFIRGGFIKSFYSTGDETYMLLENRSFNREQEGYIVFKMALSNIKRIFVNIKSMERVAQNPQISSPVQPKQELSIDLNASILESHTRTIEKLERELSEKDAEIKSLNRRISILETGLEKIVKYLKKKE